VTREGPTTPRTVLLVNADDLAYDPEIDRGILEAHARGLVTAASAMVDTPYAARSLGEAPRSLDLGLHAVVRPEAGPAEAGQELARQLELFRALRGESPTHLDSHRHHHASPALLPVFVAAARRERLPLRSLDAAMRDAFRVAGVATPGAFLGDAGLRPCWTRPRLLAALAALPGGTVELMCHPGYAPSHARTSFGAERAEELAALCDPGASRALAAAGARSGRFAELAPGPA
jgi:predicted glycoside hydrolase/deacetylase ChbG (UPF0249 family)